MSESSNDPIGQPRPAAEPTILAGPTFSSTQPGEPTATGATSPSLPAGSEVMVGSVLGPYRLLSILGEGGMGAVFKAQHEHLDKVVAVKVLPQHITRNADAVARFKREMKAVGRIDHPNIVRAMDAGEVQGVHFLAMEYVVGTDLSKWVSSHGPMPVTQACDVIRQAALALAAAHEAGLIHRDIKPANLLLTKSGQIKLLDLGLALLGGETEASTELTAAGQTFGTPDYMSPEQWEDPHATDARTDLYALGCTLYFLLVGRAPFATDKTRTAMAKMKAHALESIPDFPATRSDIPLPLRNVYRKLLAKNPSERIQTAADLAEALAQFNTAHSIPVATVISPRSVVGTASGGRQPPDSPTVVVTAAIQVPNPSGTDSPATIPNQRATATGQPDAALPLTIDTSRGQTSTPIKSPPKKKGWLPYSLVGGAAVLVLCGLIFTLWKGKPPQTKDPRNQARQGKAPPASAANPRSGNDTEREIAEWIINNGGDVVLVDQLVAIAKVADLPRQHFSVGQINTRNAAKFDVADAQRLTELKELKSARFHTTTLEKGAIQTLAACRHLHSLFVSGGGTSESTLSEVIHIPQLRSLQYDNIAVSDDLFARLGQLERLQFVQVYGGKLLTDQALIRLSAAPPPKLQSLHLGGRKITAAELRAVARLPHLQDLTLVNMDVDDAGIAELASCKSLAYLNVSIARVTQNGTTELQKVLNGCQIHVDKSAQAPLLNGPAYRDTLRRLLKRGFMVLVYTDVNFGATWMRGDAPFPQGDNIFAFQLSTGFDGEIVDIELADLQLIAKISDLGRLTHWILPPNGLHELLPLKNLTTLHILGPLTETDIELLPSFPKLSSLSAIVPSDAALTMIAALPHLSYLNFVPGTKITDEGLKALESASLLSDLNLAGSNVSLSAAQAFANARPDVIVIWKGNQRLDPVPARKSD